MIDDTAHSLYSFTEMKNSPIVAAMFLPLFINSLKPIARAENLPRVFTNQAGVKMEATIMEFLADGKVRIRRTTDAREFDIPVLSLSPEDQQYLKEMRLASQNTSSGDGVNVSVADPLDRVRFGLNESMAESTHSRRYIFPSGVWLSYFSSPHVTEFRFLYKGEKNLEFSVEDGWKFFLSRDGGSPELVAAVLSRKDDPPETFSVRFREISGNPSIRDSIHVTVGDPADLDLIATLPEDIPLSLSLRSPIPESTAVLLSSKNVVALGARSISGIAEWLPLFQRLNYLDLQVETESSDDQKAIPTIPSLRQLEVFYSPPAPDLTGILAKLPNLETLQIFAGGTTSNGPPIRSFASHPKLKTLSLRGGEVQFTPEAVGTVPGLECLHIDKLQHFKSDADFKSFLTLQRLRSLYISDVDFPERILELWAENGAFKELRLLLSNYCPPLEHLPVLEYLSINQFSAEADRRSQGLKLQNAPVSLSHLAYFTSGHAEVRDFPHPNNLVYLTLFGSSLESMDVLEQFTKLRELSLAGSDAEKIKTIDLLAFPELRSLTLQSLPELTAIGNVSNHPSLVEISISNSKKLASLGAASPNTQILEIHLNGLDRLQNLDAFGETTGCRVLMIGRCNALTDMGDFTKRNDLNRLLISGCAGFPDRNEVR